MFKKSDIFANTSSISWNIWMKSLPDASLLSGLSIPGTHDSGTFKLSSPITQIWAMTQDKDFEQQCNFGVRFFDIRGRSIENDTIVLHHSVINLKVSLWDFINDAKKFLNENPSESIIMSLKEDYKQKPNVTKAFSDIFFDTYYPDAVFYKGDNPNPTLGETRGKIVLLKRYISQRGEAGYAPATWKDNATFMTGSQREDGPDFYIQDEYKQDQDNKITAVKNLLSSANTDTYPDNLYINFTSLASRGTKTTSPCAYAAYINKTIAQYVSDSLHHRSGWVIMDYVGDSWQPELYKTIIMRNFQDLSVDNQQETGAAPQPAQLTDTHTY